MKVSYPAVFHKEKTGIYSVYFPDFGQVTLGKNLKDANLMAKYCLRLSIDICREDHREIPTPMPIKDIDPHELETSDEILQTFVEMVTINYQECNHY